jgi:hypothetical protein
MTAKKCKKCGKKNPHFFTHCVDCGAKLEVDTRAAEKTSSSLKVGLALCVSVILIIFVILPVIQYSHSYGRNFSEAVSVKSAADSQKNPEYTLNQPVSNSDLQIKVLSARDGQNTYNSNKFFLVSVHLKNNRSSGNVLVSGSDFELIDAEGTRYFPYGMGSRVMYDLSPSQESTVELTYVISQKLVGKKIQFTYQGTSEFASGSNVAVFGF